MIGAKDAMMILSEKNLAAAFGLPKAISSLAMI
jgi:hypothetical protein